MTFQVLNISGRSGFGRPPAALSRGVYRCSNWRCLPFRAEARFVVLTASRFPSILSSLKSRSASDAYDGAPLSTLSPSMRGHVLQDLVRAIDREIHPRSVFEDARPGECINGHQRGLARAEYDWSRDGLRIECKSAMLRWTSSAKCWRFHFKAVKLAFSQTRARPLFDELLLALYTPRDIYVYRHDGKFGLSTAGRRTACDGHQIFLGGLRNEENWSLSLEAITSKLDGKTNGCSLLYRMPLTDRRVNLTLSRRPGISSQHIFHNAPLAGASPSERGRKIEALVRRVDEITHPGALITDPIPGQSVSGLPRRHDQAEFDWCRNGSRIECKSGQLAWDAYWRRWKVSFSNIKLADSGTRPCLFDELLLALYAPCGIYVFKHNLQFGLSSRGQATAACGFQIQVYGTCNDFDWTSSLDAILGKLDSAGCMRIAYVQW